jgi:hypothetical protein
MERVYLCPECKFPAPEKNSRCIRWLETTHDKDGKPTFQVKQCQGSLKWFHIKPAEVTTDDVIDEITSVIADDSELFKMYESYDDQLKIRAVLLARDKVAAGG